MATIIANGKTFEVDEDGFLKDLDDWNPAIAEAMSAQDDLKLTAEHWDVINFLREYFEEYQISPAIRILKKAMGKKLGKAKGSTKYLYALFLLSPAKQAARYAGLPKPTGCI